MLAGYCMGGLLAVAAAQRRPDLVAALALLATPWDFHAADPERAATDGPAGAAAGAGHGVRRHAAGRRAADCCSPCSTRSASAPKYRAFGRLDPDSERARLFVALEDWLNDGVPLAAPVARECLTGWYGANTPARGNWTGGRAAGVAGGARPALFRRRAGARPHRAAGERPPARRGLIPGAVLHAPAAGHIGMAAGSGAEAALWRPLLGWVRGPAAPRLTVRAGRGPASSGGRTGRPGAAPSCGP